MKLNWKLYNRQKVINLCYFGAVTAAFILSLAHNNRVEASVDTRDYFSYLMIDDNADTSETAMESPDNIKALFKMVDELVKNKNIEKELILQSGDTLISALIRLDIPRATANDIYYSLKEHFDP